MKEAMQKYLEEATRAVQCGTRAVPFDDRLYVPEEVLIFLADQRGVAPERVRALIDTGFLRPQRRRGELALYNCLRSLERVGYIGALGRASPWPNESPGCGNTCSKPARWAARPERLSGSGWLSGRPATVSPISPKRAASFWERSAAGRFDLSISVCRKGTVAAAKSYLGFHKGGLHFWTKAPVSCGWPLPSS